MKNLTKLNWSKALTILMVMAIAACTIENPGPQLGDKSNYTAPVITNPATADPTVFKIDSAATKYEKFEWKRTDYGGPVLSTDYVMQIDTSTSFSHWKQLLKTPNDSITVSVEQFNNAVLSLGVPGFTEATVHLRLMSTINGFAMDTLYSNVIDRTVTTYRSSDCGTYCTVGIIGDGTPGGWGTDTDMRIADPSDKHTWTATLYLTQASAKFRAQDAWDFNWGASDFPAGTGTQNGNNIPISAAGYYKVMFNDETGAYTFTAQASPTYGVIGLIGDATPGGWNTDTDMTQDGSNPHVWTATITLVAGGVKFRADHDWTNNWGHAEFPSGYGVGNGDNIPATANTYFVWFNDATGEYHFGSTNTSGNYNFVSLIGAGSPSGDWGIDTDLTKNPSNGILFSQIVTMKDGDAKFRADHDWAVNWGGAGFPAGTGLLNGPNIPSKASKYFVTINTLTGEYKFLK